MNELRLLWEPESSLDESIVSNQVLKYMDHLETFAQFPNGTCLFLKPLPNIEVVIEGAMKEARRLTDFEVFEMEDHDFLVSFASPLKVYVGKSEFEQRRLEVKKRIAELHFPSETLTPLGEKTKPLHALIGLYARGKLQRDAWQSTYKIVRPFEM